MLYFELPVTDIMLHRWFIYVSLSDEHDVMYIFGQFVISEVLSACQTDVMP